MFTWGKSYEFEERIANVVDISYEMNFFQTQSYKVIKMHLYDSSFLMKDWGCIFWNNDGFILDYYSE